MRLLDLVEQHDGIRFATHRLAELAAFLEAHIARRRADQSRDAVFFHVLAHVDADHGVLVVEEKLGQRFAQLRFTHARRSEEDEGTDGAVLILQPGARAAHRVADCRNGPALPDHPGAEPVFHADEFLAFALAQV